MKVSLISSEGGLARVRLEGDLSPSHNKISGDLLEKCLGMGCYGYNVLANLERAAMIDSTGVASLVRCHIQFQKAGGKLVLHSIPPLIKHVLHLLNMQSVLHLAEDESAALALLQEQKA